MSCHSQQDPEQFVVHSDDDKWEFKVQCDDENRMCIKHNTEDNDNTMCIKHDIKPQQTLIKISTHADQNHNKRITTPKASEQLRVRMNIDPISLNYMSIQDEDKNVHQGPADNFLFAESQQSQHQNESQPDAIGNKRMITTNTCQQTQVVMSIDDSMSNEDNDQEEFTVKNIVNYRTAKDGTLEFLVQWDGYEGTDEEFSWEPELSLNHLFVYWEFLGIKPPADNENDKDDALYIPPESTETQEHRKHTTSNADAQQNNYNQRIESSTKHRDVLAIEFNPPPQYDPPTG
eukprot:975352_1